MHTLDVAYNKYYFPTVLNRIKSRKRNHLKNFTLLTANCMAGYIYHQLGCSFQSPTVNLMMLQPDFYKLVQNLKVYSSKRFTELPTGVGGVPRGLLDDLVVNFTHYRTYQDGIEAWYKRFHRVDYSNIYIIATDRDGVGKSDIKALGNVKCKKILCFTADKYDYPWCFQIEQFAGESQIGDIIGKTLSGKWRFENFFDYVGWLNSDDGVAENFKI